MAKIERVNLLLERSNRFLEQSIECLNKGYYDLAIFHADQALQLFLKAVLLKITGFYPEVHKIRELLGILYNITRREEIEDVVKKYRDVLVKIENAYTESRYGLVEYTKDTAEKVIDVTINVINTVKAVIGERC